MLLGNRKLEMTNFTYASVHFFYDSFILYQYYRVLLDLVKSSITIDPFTFRNKTSSNYWLAKQHLLQIALAYPLDQIGPATGTKRKEDLGCLATS